MMYIVFILFIIRDLNGVLVQHGSNICVGPAWSCQDKCENNQVLPCSCHPTCSKYQICCEDYEEYCEPNKSNNANISQSINQQVSSDEDPSNHKENFTLYCSDIIAAWLEGGCENQSDYYNYERCIRHNNTILVDMIPATDPITKVHYRNIFCAMCNGAVDAVPWLEAEKCITTTNSSLNQCITEMKSPIVDQPVTCIPNVVSTFIRTESLQMNLTEKEITEFEDQCEAFTSYVLDSNNGKIYRNRYCYFLDYHSNDTTCRPPPIDTEDRHCYDTRRHYINQCMAEICANRYESKSIFCPNETFDFNMNLLFAVGNTDDLDLVEDEKYLMMKGGEVLNDHIADALSSNSNISLSCIFITKSEKSVEILIRGYTRSLYMFLECNIGDDLNGNLSTADILQVISQGVESVNDKIQIPMKIEITVCILRTTSYRNPSSFCSRTSFDINDIIVVNSPSLDAESYISTACCILSDLGLSIRIALQFIVPYFQTLPGKIQLCLCCTLFVAYSSFLVGGIVQIKTTVCYIAAVITHWGLLSSLFWMNVIAFQVWRTFRVWHSQITNKGVRVLILSGIYAMGIPSLIIATGLTIEFIYPKNPLSPAYGIYSCWMNKSYSVLTWFVIPCCTLSIVNTLFAVLSVRGLHVHRTMEKAASLSQNTPVNDITVSVRIVILVGVTWLLGLFAAFLGSPVTWMIFTIFNASLGFFISLVLVCNRRVFKLLKNKCLCPTIETFSSMTANSTRISPQT